MLSLCVKCNRVKEHLPSRLTKHENKSPKSSITLFHISEIEFAAPFNRCIDFILLARPSAGEEGEHQGGWNGGWRWCDDRIGVMRCSITLPPSSRLFIMCSPPLWTFQGHTVCLIYVFRWPFFNPFLTSFVHLIHWQLLDAACRGWVVVVVAIPSCLFRCCCCLHYSYHDMLFCENINVSLCSSVISGYFRLGD